MKNRSEKLINIFRESETLDAAIERAVTELNYSAAELVLDAQQINSALSPVIEENEK